MTMFGRRDVWAIELDPLAGPPTEPEPAAARTWAAIRIWVEGKNITAHTRTDSATVSDALHWPAVNLARWFLSAWNGLWERAGWPLGVPLLDAREACLRLDAHLAQNDDPLDDSVLDRRDAFVQSHAWLSGAAGGVMPDLYLLREGQTVHVVWVESSEESPVRFHCPQDRARLPVSVFLDVIEDFMHWCRDATAGVDPGFGREIEAWHSGIRGPRAARSLLWGFVQPWGASQNGASIEQIEPLLELPAGWDSEGQRFDPAQVPVAVMFRAVSPVLNRQDVVRLIDRLRSNSANPLACTKLEEFQSKLSFSSIELPHKQGYSLAERVRRQLGNDDQYLDVEVLVKSFGVEVSDDDLLDASIDAATIWDEQHGPVIVVNRVSKHQAQWARRMTVAHELCHLLVDRNRSARLMIASTPWAPPEMERRANAFAAELLLPRAGILKELATEIRSGSITDSARTRLMDRFGVGETVCGHQLQNQLPWVE